NSLIQFSVLSFLMILPYTFSYSEHQKKILVFLDVLFANPSTTHLQAYKIAPPPALFPLQAYHAIFQLSSPYFEALLYKHKKKSIGHHREKSDMPFLKSS